MFPATLQTKRLELREWTADDFDAIQLYAADPEVIRYMDWGPNTGEDTQRFLNDVMESARREPRTAYEFAITLRDSGELIGGCGIRLRDPNHRSGDLGYTFRRDCWGKGYATECANALLRFGFDELKM